MSGVIEFSVPARTWVWTCSWGCCGFDYEGEREAHEAFISHACDRRCP